MSRLPTAASWRWIRRPTGKSGPTSCPAAIRRHKSPTSPSIVYKNLILIGGRLGEGSGPGRPGDVIAYDLHDGRQAWTFHSIPQKGEPNFGTSWYGDSAN